MRRISEAAGRVTLALALSLVLLGACRWEVRGGTHGYTMSPVSKYPLFTRSQHPSLGSAGSRVAVLDDPPPGCLAVAEITSTAGPAPDTLLGEDPAHLEARLPWPEAIAGARNQAASAGATALVVESIGIFEHHLPYPHGVFCAVYARAYRYAADAHRAGR